MAEEKNEKLGKIKKRIDVANKIRIACLLIAVVPLLFLYFGGKVWKETTWFNQTTGIIYSALIWDILLMFVMSILKLIFATQYNKIIKSL